MLTKQLVEFVLAEIVVRQLQKRFAYLQREPNDGLADQAWSPIHRADQPRTANRRQLAGGSSVEHKDTVRMLLQEARRDGIGHLAFHGPLDDRRLVLTKRHNGDFAGFENGA